MTDAWRHRIAAVVSDVAFRPPAQGEAIEELEAGLGVSLPDELRALLFETDGLTADYGADIVWSASQILRRNLEMRRTEAFESLYMPFQCLLFFGDDGGGDMYAFPIQADGRINNPDIFQWNHETDARIWLASGLRMFFEQRFKDGNDVGQ